MSKNIIVSSLGLYMKVFYCFLEKYKQIKAGITMPENGGIYMKIVRKLVSLALSVMVVAGCGAIVNADTTKIAIDSKNFPDTYFRMYVQTVFDDNRDGYLNSKEMSSKQLINLTGSDAVSLKGIEYLNVNKLFIMESSVSEIDLTDTTIPEVVIMCCNGLKSFKGGSAQKSIEISFCKYIKKVDVSNCRYLNDLMLVNNENLSSADVSKNRFLTELTISDCDKITSINFNDYATIKVLFINSESITNLDLSKVLSPKTIKSIDIRTGGKLRTTWYSGEMLNYLWNHRRSNGCGYYYLSDNVYINIW